MTEGAATTVVSTRPQSKMVLVLLPGLGHSFFSVIINALEEVLVEAGYGVIFGDTRDDPRREAHYVRLVRAGQADGILLFSGHMPQTDFALLSHIVPITLVCNDIAEMKDVPVFEIANRDAARMMVEHLIGVGHRRIAHISGPATNIEARERTSGYTDALTAAGIPVDESLIWPGNFNFVAGAKAAARFLALADRPTAIFATSDDIAIGCMKALKDSGLRIPEDVSIAGFDGIDYSAMYDPALTTVIQPRAELGRLSAGNLLKRMRREVPEETPKRTRIPCSLIIRGSVAPPKAVEAVATTDDLRALVTGFSVRGRKAEASL